MKVTIKGNEIELKYSIRALMMYENAEGKSFYPTNTTEVITFMYCVILASSKDYSITFDDVLDAIDEDPNILTEFSKWLTDTSDNQNKLKKE